MMVERQANPAARQSHREQAKRPAWRRHVAGTRDATRPVLCVQRLNALSGNAIDLAFAWDPTEPVATRPITMQRQGGWSFFCTHDGNKNVSEVVSFQQARGVPAHYEYAPFGAVTEATRNTTITAFDVRTLNPFRFSSEYADDTLGLVYYNYRHYEPVTGRWLSRDAKGEEGVYVFINNCSIFNYDKLGLTLVTSDKPFPGAQNMFDLWGSLDELTFSLPKKLPSNLMLPNYDEPSFERPWRRYVDDGQKHEVELNYVTKSDLQREMRRLAVKLCKLERCYNGRQREIDDEICFDTGYFSGPNEPHNYYYVEGDHDIWADNEINYIGIGMYEKWLGTSALGNYAIILAWKVIWWRSLPTNGTFLWNDFGREHFAAYYNALDKCTCQPKDGSTWATDIPTE